MLKIRNNGRSLGRLHTPVRLLAMRRALVCGYARGQVRFASAAARPSAAVATSSSSSSTAASSSSPSSSTFSNDHALVPIHSHTFNPGTDLDLGWIERVRVNASAIERRAATLGGRRTVKSNEQMAWLLRAITCTWCVRRGGGGTTWW